ncbi:MAG: HD domain-containing protein [Chloroflexi bacterium]|nr:HD domain-containing protein [Chloroflexota bacterium]
MPNAASQLQAIFDAFPDLLFILDNDGTILDYKSGNNTFFFVPPEEFLNKRVQDVLPQDVGSKIGRAIEKVNRTGETISVDYSLLLDGEEQWFEARLAPTADGYIVDVVRCTTEHKRKETQIQRQLKRLAALRSIDLAISSSLDINLTLSMLLSHVTAQLEVDAADILVLKPKANLLEFAAGLGFKTPFLQLTRLRVGDGYAGIAALERRIVHVANISNRKTDILRSPIFSQEAFVDHYAVPLIAKGKVRGVLEIFHRSPLNTDPDWLNFLETLAGQAAIAIDNAMLFDDLQRSHAELMLAYNATIEGWSHALDLRDKETEGHTRRVVEMTLRLARLMGIPDEALTHIQRGALLHDIGKMGVPDNILLKPGPLTEEEWDIMHQHPQYAYRMLSSIDYLKPALTIPHYHHEKWDGTGYPHGLKGKQIPLEARIFTVADVFDALTSNRPYRSAWSHEKALAYIQAESGTHFDPQIVDIFLKMLAELEQQEKSNEYYLL